jgi:hypothetical protein
MEFFFFRMLPFSLPGFEVQEITTGETVLTITAGATAPTALCPTCGQESHRLHSYYTRRPADLPVSGHPVRLCLRVRRFRCQNPTCQQQTFVEPLPEVVPYGRQTKRFRAVLKLLAIALSGQAGSRLLNHLGMAVSGQTGVRLVKSSARSSIIAPDILGVLARSGRTRSQAYSRRTA